MNDLFTEIIKEKYGQDFEIDPDSKQFRPYIIVDIMEKRSGIVNELELLGANVIVKKLDAGDYLLSSATGVERKRGDDYYGSLFAGSNKTNIFDELDRLKKSVDNPILILEDMERMFKRGEKSKSSLYGAMSKIAIRVKIPIIPTRNVSDTALLLYRMAWQEQKKKGSSAVARRAPKGMTLRERQAYFLEGFFNVGPKKAKQILEVFGSPIEFLEAIMNTQYTYDNNMKINGIKGELTKLKGLGVKFLKQNWELLIY